MADIVQEDMGTPLTKKRTYDMPPKVSNFLRHIIHGRFFISNSFYIVREVRKSP
jgi:hypothetical protein